MRDRILNNKGMTLIELIISLAIISFVLLGVFTLFSFSNKVYDKGNNQFDIQSNTRTAATVISRETLYATNITILSDSDIIPADASTLSPDEGYIFFDNSNGHFVNLSKTSSFKTEIGNLTGCGVTFTRVDGNKTLDFDIIGKIKDQTFEVGSKVLCLNLKQKGIDIDGELSGKAIHYFKTLTPTPTVTPSITPSITPTVTPTVTPSITPPIVFVKPKLQIYTVPNGSVNASLVKTFDLSTDDTKEIIDVPSDDVSVLSENCGIAKLQFVDNKNLKLTVTSLKKNFAMSFKVIYTDSTEITYTVRYIKIGNSNEWIISS